MKRSIVAIGGEDWQNLKESTLSIDQEIVRLAERTHPRLLFLPTAQLGEEIEPAYRAAFREHFEDLGCEVHEILMTEDAAPPAETMADALWNTDIVYIGGGNTKRMLQMWKKHGFDTMLLDAWREGKVMAGVSAGAICWFQSGHSDSMSFWQPNDWQYIMVEGFGIIPAVACPHFDGYGGPKGQEKPRKDHFSNMMLTLDSIGIALENETALEVIDDTWRVLASKPGKAVWRLYRVGNEVIQERLDPSETFQPLSALLQRSQ